MDLSLSLSLFLSLSLSPRARSLSLGSDCQFLIDTAPASCRAPSHIAGIGNRHRLPCILVAVFATGLPVAVSQVTHPTTRIYPPLPWGWLCLT
jgi:hypothetical protein